MAKFEAVATITPDTSNEIFNIAVDLVNQSSRNIFLTGKAGTGKTTFLKYIRENSHKQLAIVAPTGVAAINAGGVTIHSFFQLPFSPFVPGSKGFGNNEDVADTHSLLSRLRLTGEKKRVIQELELLIIDEISMVRCDTLDAIDTVMRHIRQRRFERFGGVQVLFIGDMFQLPPVVPDQEWRILSDFYDSPYFFDSKVVAEEPPVYIEFNKIYRQSEERFIHLLNQVRNNQVDEQGVEILDSRFQPSFRRSKDDGYIILTTHNRKADAINSEELQKISEKVHSFAATIEGDFSEKAYPADERLLLKVGAQVMFVKNDPEKTRRYYNGKIGKVTRMENDKIFVLCKNEDDEVEVKKEKWENVRYSVNKNTRQLEEEVLGSFNQFPLRLAWAITIHKSQGLTFEKAIIDAGEAFAPGQVYVALSRCTSLSGLVLQSKVRSSSLHSDSRIVAFSHRGSTSAHLQNELVTAKRNYRLAVLVAIFDFALSLESLRALMIYIAENSSSFNKETPAWVTQLKDKINNLQEISTKFQSQLKYMIAQNTDEHLVQERIKAATSFFVPRIEDVIGVLHYSPAVTDSRLHAKEYNDSLREIFAQVSLKKHILPAFENGFDLEKYQHQKLSFLLPAFTVNAYATASVQQRIESPHPVLHQQLRKLRDAICAKKDLPVYFVLTGKTLDEMAAYLPQSLGELQKLSGFGKAKIESYGQQFLDVIIDYSNKNGFSSLVHERPAKRERITGGNNDKAGKPDTKSLSFELFKAGKTVAEIASERKLVLQTIEGHLAHYIRQGEINIDKLINREKLVILERAIKEVNGGSINSIKERVGSTIGFGEIRLAMAWYDFKNGHDIKDDE